MATWQEENLSAILEYPFDFDRYIAEQLREIDDLDERILQKSSDGRPWARHPADRAEIPGAGKAGVSGNFHTG